VEAHGLGIVVGVQERGLDDRGDRPGVSSQTVSASTSRRLARMFLMPLTNAVDRICPRWR
jgi:hypothetical protein